jgi:hypothetical protein
MQRSQLVTAVLWIRIHGSGTANRIVLHRGIYRQSKLGVIYLIMKYLHLSQNVLISDYGSGCADPGMRTVYYCTEKYTDRNKPALYMIMKSLHLNYTVLND